MITRHGRTRFCSTHLAPEQRARFGEGAFLSPEATVMSHANELLPALASYLPRLLLRAIVADPAAPSAPARAELRGALLFADIVGFTSLAERFAGTGPQGVERVTEVLNAAVGPLIACVDAHGGDIVKFAGDALLAFWPAEEPALAEAARQAAGCGLALQRAVAERDPADGLRLELRVGLGAGALTLMRLGGALGRWELLLAGAPLLQVRVAALQAQPGDVVAAAEVWPLLREAAQGRVLPAGVQIQHVAGDALPTPTACPALDTRHLAALSAFIPGTVRQRLHDHPATWLGELRRVTVLFVRMPDLHAATPLERAQALVLAVQEQLYRYEGSLNKLSVDDKGAALVCAFGMPPLAHPDDARRGLLAALAVGAALEGLGARYAIGVTTGQVFCGEVGSALRREYTLIGDVVNLAARLMELAGVAPAGQRPILCDAPTAQAAEQHLALDPLPPTRVKGKSAPLALFHPRQRGAQEPAAARALVGRQTERGVLEQALARLLRGESEPTSGAAVLVIEGEAGMGKSRLTAELIGQARAARALVLLGAADPSQQTTPLYAWRPVISALLGLDPQAERATRAAQVQTALASAPDLLALAPLLNPLLAIDLPEHESTRVLAGAQRAEQTRALLLRLLNASAHTVPTLLVLEDTHWLDSASWALTLAACRTVTPLLVLAVTRPPADAPAPDTTPYTELLAHPGAQHLVLEGLSPDESAALVRQCLEVGSLPAAVAERIVARAQGNPYFTQELAYAMRDAGLILTVGGTCQIAPDAGPPQSWQIPDSVQSAITSRIDRLTPRQQLTLKVASVVGRSFPVRLLRMLEPLAHNPEQLDTNLDILALLDITPQEHPDPDRVYMFKHAITQEVTYGLLLFAQRRELHRQVGEALETIHGGQTREVQDLLGDHFWRAELWERAASYLSSAGDGATHLFAYPEARTHYERALAALERLPDSPANRRQRASLLIRLVTVSLVTASPGQNLDRLSEAERLLGLARLDAHADPAELRQRYSLAYALGRAHYYYTQPQQALRDFEQMRQVAQALGAPDLEALSSSMIGRVLSLQGHFEQALPLIEAAFPALEREGNWSDWLWNRGYVGFCRGALGQYASGVAECQWAISTADTRRHTTARVVTGLFLAMTHWQGGALPEAVETADQTIERGLAAGDLMPLHLAYGFRAWALARAGQAEAAEASWDKYAAIVQRLGGRLVYADWFAAARAELLLGRDDPAAIQAAGQAVALAQAVGGVFAEGIAQRVWAQALARAGADWPAIEARLQASAWVLASGTAQAELARTHLAWGQLARQRGLDGPASAHHAVAAALFRSLPPCRTNDS